MLAVSVAFAGVVAVVALLAECSQVAFGIVGRVVVEVRSGKDNLATSLGMRPTVGGSAPFTAALGALEADALGDLGPVGRVEVLQGWMDRHCISFVARTFRSAVYPPITHKIRCRSALIVGGVEFVSCSLSLRLGWFDFR